MTKKWVRKLFFDPLVVTRLFKIKFCTKQVFDKTFIKMHRFQLIDQTKISEGFLRPMVMAHLFRIEYPTKKVLAKTCMKMHRFQLIDQKLNSKGFFSTNGDGTFVQKSTFYKSVCKEMQHLCPNSQFSKLYFSKST